MRGSATQDGAGRNKGPPTSSIHPAISKSVIASPATVGAAGCNIRSMRSLSPYLIAAWSRLVSGPSIVLHPPGVSSQRPSPELRWVRVRRVMYLLFGRTQAGLHRRARSFARGVVVVVDAGSNPSQGREAAASGAERSKWEELLSSQNHKEEAVDTAMRCLDIHYRASGDGFDTWETWFCLGGCRDPHQLMSELSAVIQQCSHGGVEGH